MGDGGWDGGGGDGGAGMGDGEVGMGGRGWGAGMGDGGWGMGEVGMGRNILIQAIDNALNDVVLPHFFGLRPWGAAPPAPTLVFIELFM
jgi:hypothetical protein